jgi:hypothetical protein
VQRLQVGVGLVLAVPDPVVGERHRLVGRLVRADHVAAAANAACRVLVDVVAEVHHQVEIAAGGEQPVGAEVAGLPVGARHDCRPAARRSPASAAGAVCVRPAGDQPSPSPNRYQYVVAGCRPRTSTLTVWSRAAPVATAPLGDDRRERGVGRDLPADGDVGAAARSGHGVGRRGDAGPQQDAVGQRVARRDAVAERRARGGTVAGAAAASAAPVAAVTAVAAVAALRTVRRGTM